MTNDRLIRQFDWIMFLSMLALVALGMMMIYSATYQTPRAHLWVRQLQWFCLAMVCYFIILRVDYRFFTDLALLWYLLSIGLLVAVLLFGKRISGAKSWFSFGYFNFEPSEVAKIAAIIMLAKYLGDEERTTLVFKDFLMAGLIMGIPMVLIMLQPELGMVLSFIPILIFLLFLAGMRWKLILLAIIGGMAMMPLSWSFLKQYQKNRILTFIDPTLDPLGSGYQILQSKIAVGSGRIFGKGLLSKDRQAYLDFIPEKQTDFIFSCLAEAFGIIGVMIALALYFIIISRILRAARLARDRTGTYIVMGLFSVFFFHIVINIGMVVGLMPITGLPLPLMSYGGSSLFSTIVGLGIIMNIHMRRYGN